MTYFVLYKNWRLLIKLGDRFYVSTKCSYCNELNEDIYISPTSGFITFTCEKCGKESFVGVELNTNTTCKKLEETTYNDIYDSISSSANFMDEDQIKSYSKQLFNDIKSKINDVGGFNMAKETETKEQEPSTESEPETSDETEEDSDDSDEIEDEDSDGEEEELVTDEVEEVVDTESADSE